MSLWLLLVALLLVAFAGLLAAADSAIGALSRADIQDLALVGRAKRSLLAIAGESGAHVNAISFLRVTSETTAAVLVTFALANAIDELWLALLLAALVMTAVSFVLVGSSPRSVGRAHARVVLRFGAPVVRGVRVLLGPIADALVLLGNWVTPGRPRSATFTSEEQLLSMVDEATELDVLEEDDRELIHSIFEFGDTVVREVMVPRTDMATIDRTATVGTAMNLFLSRGYSRLPVTEENDPDEIAGILHLRDLARLMHEGTADVESRPVAGLIRPALFVPESKKADDMLRQMQLESNHIAMVVDEYGGIAGLVTLEDIIEELVGDIADEYDKADGEVEDLGGGIYRVSARLPIDELGDLFQLELDDDDVDSVGGLLTKALGRLPVKGSVARVDGLLLTAERTDGRRRRLRTVRVERDPEAPTSDDDDRREDTRRAEEREAESRRADDRRTERREAQERREERAEERRAERRPQPEVTR
ncbi:MAG: putative integral rane protein [Naasia sp.]|jgi:CBS domain containing-hemolysin-like protein|uniref:hemolysin family protein n=1 Tax=Naasia sp. TaxID=2546198 RepID=UPI00261E25AB|nr:hemolysin family protein [Naasia sp.]MCU1570008.1 putative integral rane protein [Naasia sp.]